MKDNLILLSDAYKCTHHLQTPPKTEVIYSYLESRGGRFPDTVVFGLQYYLKRYLAGPVIEQWMIEEADEVLGDLFGVDYFNRAGWQKIVDVHGGRLPVRI
jgi:nicotinamide phosphoribosyltransferase